MIDPAIIQLLAGLVQLVPGIIAALSPDAKAAIGERVAAARAALPQPTSGAVEATIARHIAARHEAVSHATADVLGRLIGPREGALLTTEEREAIRVAIPALRAIAEAREVPAVLDVPVGAWSEPGHPENE